MRDYEKGSIRNSVNRVRMWKITQKSGLLFLSCIFLYLAEWPVVAAGPLPEKNEAASVEMLLEKLEDQMRHNRLQIEQGNYKAANAGKADLIRDLSTLVDLFLPLPEKIKQLLDDQMQIIAQTRSISETTEPSQNLKAEILGPIQKKQRSNLEKTEAIAKLIRSERRRAQSKKEAEDLAQQRTILTAVEGHLRQSKKSQQTAVADLNRQELASALAAEIKAGESLKKALEAFQQQQSQQSRQPSEGREDAGDGQRQKRQQDAEGSADRQPQQNGQQTSTDESVSESPSAGDATPPRKEMTAREALEELYRLQKQAEAEKQKREKAMGAETAPGRAPVEKDW